MGDLESHENKKLNLALVPNDIRPRVECVLDDIVRCLDRDLPSRFGEHGVGSGNGGAVLVHTYLALAGHDDRHRLAVEKYIEVLADAGSEKYIMSLYSSAVGSAWVMNFAGSRLGVAHDLEEIDAFLMGLLESHPWRGRYDLVSGLVGVGVYALDRADQDTEWRLLREVVRHLVSQARRSDGYWFWRTPYHHLGPLERVRHPNGHVNLGLAHGMWGCIWLLAHGVSLGIADQRAEQVLEGAVSFIMSRFEFKSGHWCLPCSVDDNGSVGPRLAWCYNELSAAFVLALAGRLTGRRPWTDRGLEIGRSTLRWSPSSTVQLDAGICHGTAGIGHIYRRFAQEFGGDDFAECGNRWLEKTLEYHQPGAEYGGFFHYRHSGSDGELTSVFSPGFLEGSTGVALVLLDWLGYADCGWNRPLALS